MFFGYNTLHVFDILIINIDNIPLVSFRISFTAEQYLGAL